MRGVITNRKPIACEWESGLKLPLPSFSGQVPCDSVLGEAPKEGPSGTSVCYISLGRV